MPDEGKTSIERLQEIMTALMERLLLDSLRQVDTAMGVWREGNIGVFETHAEILKHAAKAERLADRMARIGLDNAGALLRDAFDAGLVDRAEFEKFVGKRPEDVLPSPPLSSPEQSLGLPDKRVLVEELLAKGPILVHIDASRTLVQVPEKFRGDPKLVLRFGYELSPAIIDLSLDDEGMCGTLTFGGVPCRCVLPWTSIYSVVSEADQKGMVWPDDVPDLVVESLQQEQSEEPSASRTLESVDEDGDMPPPKPPGDKPPRGGHLKLVK